MEEAVRSKIVPLEGLSFVRDDGRPYGVLRSSGNPDQQTLISEYEIYRDDLAGVLYDMTRNNERIKYIFSEQIESMEDIDKGDGPIRVNFQGNTRSAQYDLVVACDGATSRTRAMGLSCSAREYTESANSWAAYFSIDKDLLNGSKIGQGFCAPGGRFIGIKPDPSGRTRVAFMKMNASNTEDEIKSFREAQRQSEQHLKQYITRIYSDAG